MSPFRNFCCGLRRKPGVAGDHSSRVRNNSSGDLQGNVEQTGDDIRKPGITGPKASRGGNQSPVLVELFTSQGCLSCPPADDLISRLGRGHLEDLGELQVPVLVLAYHVDYWDYMGWKDPFAYPRWTLRQRGYGQVLKQDSIYTPEAVVQGCSHCIASNGATIFSLVQEAPRFPALDIHVTFEQPSPAEVNVSLSITMKTKVEGYTLSVMVAFYENGLVTNCDRGENKGRILTNDYVVRRLETVLTLQDLPSKKTATGEATIALWEEFVRSKAGVIVFLQNPESLEVFGAQQLEFPEHVN